MISGLLFLTLSLIINFLAGTYASSQAGNAVRDLILDHVPVVNVNVVFIYGIILFYTFVGYLVLSNHKHAPFILRSLSVFILVRSFFIILTHIGPAQGALAYSPNNITSYFNFTGDLFFSGHTGAPFLMALIYWKNFKLRLLFLFTSILFGIVVLLGHLHYSIDVFSAFFITYGTFEISKNIFKKEYHLLNSKI